MLLAAKVGVAVAGVEVVHAAGKDVLLVERFDRPEYGTRRIVLSVLTILGLHESSARYASYTDIAHSIRAESWGSVSATLREMFTRLAFNVCIGNDGDHLRNHAAFWDGKQLELTPAYDLCPQPRATSVSAQAIGITADERYSQLRVVREAAGAFHLTNPEADEVITGVVDTIRASWDDVRHRAQLTTAEASQLWGREIVNDYIFYDQA